jgi:hypothetical protein
MSLPESAAIEATALLSTLIAELFEDANPADIAGLRGPDWIVRAAQLEILGRDVATLSAAIEVLMRRSDVG